MITFAVSSWNGSRLCWGATC